MSDHHGDKLYYESQASNICDGEVDSQPSSENEGFQLCNTTFPPSAVIQCKMFSYFYDQGHNVTIWATPCDGRQECANGEDESGCHERKTFVFICFLVMYFMACVIAGKMIHLPWYK